MRVLSVAPREADAVGSLKVCRGETAVGETREEGGSFNLGCALSNFCREGFSPKGRGDVFLEYTPYTLVEEESTP